jgi:hypothetical protein
MPQFRTLCHYWTLYAVSGFAGLVLAALVSSPALSTAAPLAGQIVVDPDYPAWLKYHQGGPFFMCGPGDPEDFLYRGTRHPNGTRNGDQMALINKLQGTGANSIYLMAVRSHGGDGDSSHNPFIDSNPASGLDQDILYQWETWFADWNDAAGRYNLNMAEANLHGTGVTARRKNWAVAMGGAYVMVYQWDIANTPISDLRSCGRLRRFMESTNFNEMSPHDALKHGGTKYVLARPGESYIAYASALSGNIGLQDMTAGIYTFQWFDVINGTTVLQNNVSVAAGDRTWKKPAGIGNELAVYITRQ